MKLDLEFSDTTIPKNATPLEAVVMVKCLNEDGNVTWYKLSTQSLNVMEALGMLRAAVIVTENTVYVEFNKDSDE